MPQAQKIENFGQKSVLRLNFKGGCSPPSPSPLATQLDRLGLVDWCNGAETKGDAWKYAIYIELPGILARLRLLPRLNQPNYSPGY